ncbi:tripartite tricarboxylate transporter TctB family protein [Neorhizobium sp. NCHU2750]|uniref:tripartite tricarboxylate transporter TctB family protein n=1 Tax=Neorhizobium sp. NCHU2750 TaxID=1825976 RepID=UPI000EB6C3D0|nr:tripartite tricarboxylate transporter TctB family [Neorhizobium sp. NCHU2750]
MQIDDNSVGDKTNVPLGTFLIVIGLAALWVARGYETGTFISMGPGFFPKTVSGCLILLGALIILFRGRDLPPAEASDVEPIKTAARLRIIGCITASNIVFAATLVPLGLPVATFLMVVIAGFGHETSRPLTILATALILAVLATLLFASLLGLQIPVLPEALQ